MDLTTSMVQCNLNPEMVLVWLLPLLGSERSSVPGENWDSLSILHSVSSGRLQNLCRHLETVKFDTNVGTRVYPLCSMRGPLTCSKFASGTHLHHRKCELPWSTDCDTTAELLFLSELELAHAPDFIAKLGGQRRELVRSLSTFIAVPGGEPSKFTWRPFALRVQSPFRDCGGITRRRQQKGPRLQRNSSRCEEGRISWLQLLEKRRKRSVMVQPCDRWSSRLMEDWAAKH